MVSCEFIKASMVNYLQSETEILPTRQSCIVSLPMRVLDGANVEVFVESVASGYMVHDGGRAMNSLESSGLIISYRMVELLGQLARRFGVSFSDGVFRAFAKESAVQDSIFAIGQCCSVAMFELLRHSPSAEEEQIKSRVGIDIRSWCAINRASIHPNRKLQGNVKQYTIDYVLGVPRKPIAVSILVPSYTASVSAERYGLQVLDTESLHYKRLAVLVRPGRWKKNARAIISRLNVATAEVDDPESLFPSTIRESLDLLAAA